MSDKITRENLQNLMDGVYPPSYVRESPISREHARRIMELVGEGEDFDPAGDYFLAWTEDRAEFLHRGGDEAPTARNTTATSWLSI